MYSSTCVTIAMFPVILGLNSYETHPTQPQSLYRKSAKHSCQTREPWNVSKRHVLWSTAWRGVSTTELNPVILAPFQQTSDCLVAIKFGPKHAANVAYWRSTGNLTLFIGGLDTELDKFTLVLSRKRSSKRRDFCLPVLRNNLNYLNIFSGRFRFTQLVFISRIILWATPGIYVIKTPFFEAVVVYRQARQPT